MINELINFITSINPVQLIGLLVILTGAAVIAGTIAGLLILKYFTKTQKLFLPKLTFAIITTLEAPIKNLLWMVGVDDHAIDVLVREINNHLLGQAFKKTKYSERILLLPACLRHPKCPAPVGREGIKCLHCGKCQITKIIKEAEALGYKTFILTGGSSVKRIIAKYKPKAIIGVACWPEIRMATAMTLKLGIPTLSVPLTKDGCVNTEVDWNELREALKMKE